MIVRNVIKAWLPLAVAMSRCWRDLSYLSVQQSYRMGANDPQIQMAEDGASALAAAEAPNQTAQAIVPAVEVDIAQSLAPYVIVFDANGKALAANAVLHGQVPNVPSGVFDFVRQHGEDRISYQPEPGVRSAVVVAAVNGGRDGFVLAGRSLREVEKRVDQLTQITGLLWAAAMAASLALVGFFQALRW